MDHVARARTEGATLEVVTTAEMGVLRLIGHPYADEESLLIPIVFILEGSSAFLTRQSLKRPVTNELLYAALDQKHGDSCLIFR
jgi:hypothetical protein